MGNALSPKPVWPDEIFVVDCPRETLFERLVSPDSVADWLGEELEYIEAVRDGDVAPGLLFKVKTEDAIAHIEVLRLVFDDGGIGEKLRWKFSWISHGPPLHSGVAPPTYEPPSLLQASPALKPAHVWLKENATMSYTTQWTLSDAPNAPGQTKVLRETFDFTHSRLLPTPFFATHSVLMKPDFSRMKEAAEHKWKHMPLPSEVASDVGKPWPWHTVA